MSNLIVVSAENNAYMAWQCKLIHFSCVSRLRQTPLIVVHETEAEVLHSDFHEIVRAGGLVRTAPNYKITTHGDSYPPRNIPATVLHALEMCSQKDSFIVLCDPDMVFVREPEFPQTLSGSYYSYVDFDHDFIEVARRQLGIQREMIEAQKEELRCGCPYVIPVNVARLLAEEWLAAIAAFPPRRWEDVMYAFGLAAIKLGLRVQLTHFTETNYWQHTKIDADVIHYCYGDETWSKRHFFSAEQAGDVWDTALNAAPDTILGEILSQIREARKFYKVYW